MLLQPSRACTQPRRRGRDLFVLHGNKFPPLLWSRPLSAQPQKQLPRPASLQAVGAVGDLEIICPAQTHSRLQEEFANMICLILSAHFHFRGVREEDTKKSLSKPLFLLVWLLISEGYLKLYQPTQKTQMYIMCSPAAKFLLCQADINLILCN